MKTRAHARTGGGRRDRDFDIVVGARIRARRELKKLKQGELAEMIGVTGPQLSRYESGETTVEPSLLATLAEKLGCKPGAFINGIQLGKGPFK